VQPTRINDKVKTDLDARLLRTLKAMARMRGEDPKRVELRGWVIHDLRRTLRTHLAALRIQDHVAEMVVGHGRKGIARVYDQYRYDIEMREALTAWAARLKSIVEPPPPSGARWCRCTGGREHGRIEETKYRLDRAGED
jgi:integrase